MRKIFLLLMMLTVTMAVKAQTIRYTDNYTKFVFHDLIRFNKAVRLPLDTLVSADTGSIAYKNGHLYVKAADGIFVRMAKYSEIGGGGSNSNIGSGFRIAVPGSNNIKTLFFGYGLSADSSTNTNGITQRVDSSTLNTFNRANYWTNKGNSGIDTTVNFFGTTDNKLIPFRHNNNPNGGMSDYGLAAGYMSGRAKMAATGRTPIAIGYRVLDAWTENTYGAMVAIGDLNYAGARSVYRSYAVGFYNHAGWDDNGHHNTSMGYAAQEGSSNAAFASSFGAESGRMASKSSYISGFGAWTNYRATCSCASLTITNAGTGYTVIDSITFSQPQISGPGKVTLRASATGTASGGGLATTTMVVNGYGYTNATVPGTGVTPVTATVWGNGTGATVSVNLTCGDGNSALGFAAGASNFTGKYNTSVGYLTGYNGLTKTDYSYVTLLGSYADISGSADISYSTALGYAAKVSTTNTISYGATGANKPQHIFGGTAAHASAQVEMISTDKGLLIPRMNTTQQNAISTPATGLMIYNTDSLTVCHYNGSAWLKMGSGGGGSSYTFSNGVTESAGAVKMGGRLTEHTTISGANSYNTRIDSSNFAITGVYGIGQDLPSYSGKSSMTFNHKKGSLRAGFAAGTQWDNASVGDFSAVLGLNGIASGYNSISLGGANTITGTSATGIGVGIKAKSYAGLAVGLHNDSANAANATAYNSANRAFEVGIGSSDASRANALTVLFNGKIGVGTTSPDSLLSVNGSLFTNGRVRLSGINTGIPSGAKRVLMATDGTLFAADTTIGGGGSGPTVGTYSTRIGLTPANGDKFIQTDVNRDAPDGEYLYLNTKWHYNPIRKESLHEFWEDFHSVQGNGGYGSDGLIYWSGSGGSIAYNNSTDDPGVARFATGTSASGFSGFYGGALNNSGGWVKLSKGATYFKTYIQIPTLSNSTDRYVFRIGLANGLLGDFSSGVYLEYDESQSANWRARTANFTSRSTTTSSITVTTGWHTLEIFVSADGTSVKYWVDNTEITSPPTSNIPGAGNGLNPQMILQRSSGASSLIDVAWVKSWQRVSTDTQ